MRSIPLGLDDALRLAALYLRHPAPSTYDGLDALLSVCTGTVPGATAAAISTAGHGRVHSTHATDGAVRDVDAWHNRLGQGPLLDQARVGSPDLAVLLVDDLAFEIDDGAVRVRVTPPFRALHSTTLRCRDGRRTALDLYAAEPDVLGLDTTVLADMFARRATSLLYGSGESPDVRLRLALRLLERALDLTRPEAELLLRPHLRRRGADPVLVAEDLVDHLVRPREHP
ncbi:hypothetical protein [Actinomycetospora soli]|uniref:hypothetical protein n=1 Tax=Actinomycetospora soli TaxID=2893887 RepID=UPI001E3C69D5|nr:hypothetical protein [Actinomycetospora soli]MCD2190559.1 hypothetical protein [Actinomycetospora soli]